MNSGQGLVSSGYKPKDEQAPPPLQQSRRNEKGEYVTIGEIEELPPQANNFKSSLFSDNKPTGSLAEKIKSPPNGAFDFSGSRGKRYEPKVE